ncbi:bifunctional folylpolyglutamate synthase/dihydrofolate synthase [Qipengyuania psychrotolerans]|uniref:Bifunctional folylpolyglutamate synthase/dihydrofolate synthase n=1 Tax=Qipengyuania psychrotolerans TaxID=2867238 RepID=A0ABX8ZAG5_9SPHN|nr:folylpolyglutamate synthase/dihydrofolate synthase family protein [Qipengyuania psychrotolerans]QZD86005.1 bifunctional folylpolyglutamate synthase/dihydrofolate synthase [Qipengyuania psychrotolerans]
MRDFARSDDAAVQAQLDRLGALSVPDGRLGLETMLALLERLGSPHLRLPPVFHVAGTNGKGSTCAFLRAMLEAEGHKVHVTTSPHLVRYNERIRVAGQLISDARLAELLAKVLDIGADLGPSFFEVTIAAAFTEFARVPADACIVEVGLGGRFDATNVLPSPAVCGIAALGIDHERFLLIPEAGTPYEPLSRIAFEKAGIAKQGVPLVTLSYPGGPRAEIIRAAHAKNAPLAMRCAEWTSEITGTALLYSDAHGKLELPLPSIAGAHQAENAALAVAMLRHQYTVTISEDAMAAGIGAARWPARLQRLGDGPLTQGRLIWLDGGHNRSAGQALADHFQGQKMHLIIGMLEAKDPAALVDPLSAMIASTTVVPVPGHDWHSIDAFPQGSKRAEDVPAALKALPDDGLLVLITGSLYLAGEVLRLNDELPD